MPDRPEGSVELRAARDEGRALFGAVVLFSVFVNLLSNRPVATACPV